MFEEVGAVLVESLDECIVLRTDTLIGIAHHFRRYECLTVGNALVVPDDLRLDDVVKREVDVPCLAALSFHLVSFHVPKRLGDALLATELRHSLIDCNPFHDGDNTAFLITTIHVQQHRECTSCYIRFYCKLNINELGHVSQPKPQAAKCYTVVKNHFPAGNDLKTVLLHNSALLCVTRFLLLSSFGFANAFPLSHAVPFFSRFIRLF